MKDAERLIAAALMVSFVFAAPAKSQTATNARSPNGAEILGPTYVPPDEPRSLARERRGTGLSVTRQLYVEEDGSTGVRKGVVGSLPLADRLELRVGLLQVTRTSHKERELQRIQPMRDVNGRQDRVAAIGLSFSF